MNKFVRMVYGLVLVLCFSAVVAMVGCSKGQGPSNEDLIKGIKTTIESNNQGYTLESPITLVEKSTADAKGELKVKAEYTIKLKDGSTKKMSVSYHMTPSIDAMGANFYLASEVK